MKTGSTRPSAESETDPDTSQSTERPVDAAEIMRRFPKSLESRTGPQSPPRYPCTWDPDFKKPRGRKDDADNP
jgi:hypothetical protein